MFDPSKLELGRKQPFTTEDFRKKIIKTSQYKPRLSQEDIEKLFTKRIDAIPELIRRNRNVKQERKRRENIPVMRSSVNSRNMKISDAEGGFLIPSLMFLLGKKIYNKIKEKKEAKLRQQQEEEEMMQNQFDDYIPQQDMMQLYNNAYNGFIGPIANEQPMYNPFTSFQPQLQPMQQQPYQSNYPIYPDIPNYPQAFFDDMMDIDMNTQPTPKETNTTPQSTSKKVRIKT